MIANQRRTVEDEKVGARCHARDIFFIYALFSNAPLNTKNEPISARFEGTRLMSLKSHYIFFIHPQEYL